MIRALPSAALVMAALLLGACRPAPDAAPTTDAPPPPEAATAADAAPGTDARMVSDETSPAGDPDFDVRAFAGIFEGTLPCADCPGIDSRLELRPDGRYEQRDEYRERDATLEASGTWTVEDGNVRLRLDPDDKGSQDRLYGIASRDELRMLGADGMPPDGAPAVSLRRSDGN